VNNTGTNSIMK